MKPCLSLMLLLYGLSFAQDLSVERIPLVANFERCSGAFKEHTLDHLSTVPGGDNVRMFEANGGGVAINDLDNDGDLDIVLANHAQANTILWNEGQLNFRTERMDIGDSRAVSILDLDADGWQDIVMSRRVSAPNYWRNQGEGSFALEILPNVTKPLYSINWADFDGDGDLDLVGGTYDAGLLTEFGNEFLQSGNAGVYVYVNDAGRFRETRLSLNAQALALAVLDLNSDNRPDILVGNDFAVPDMIWLKSEYGWERAQPFSTMSHSTMSFDAADIDNNGSFELFSTDMKPYPNEALKPWMPVLEAMMSDPHAEGDPQKMENVLQELNGDSFINSALARGIDATGWSWSAKFGDFDQDGFLDLYVVNGMMEQTTFAHLKNHELVEQNQAFRNDGTGQFEPMPRWKLGVKESGRGMSMADLDGDGDLDIVVNNLRSAAKLFENQLCSGSSLQVDLKWLGTSNVRAIGANLKLHTDSSSYTRDVRAISGYLSGDASRVHFGFPNHETIRLLEIIWPDGAVSKIYDAEPNELLIIYR